MSVFKNQFKVNQAKEKFISEVLPLIEALKPEDAQELHRVFRCVGCDDQRRKVYYLNGRYELSKKGKVSKEVEDFLNYLENQNQTYWNETIQALYLQYSAG